MVGASVLVMAALHEGSAMTGAEAIALVGWALLAFVVVGAVQILGHPLLEGRFPVTKGDPLVRLVFPFFQIATGPFVTLQLLWVMFFEPPEAREILEARKQELLLPGGCGKRPILLAAYASR